MPSGTHADSLKYPERHVVTALRTADERPAAPRRSIVRGSLPPEAVVGAEHKDVDHPSTW